MSSAYDSYEVIGEHQESSDEYSNESEKNWSTTDATIEVNDYVIELLEILCEANTLNEVEYTSIGYHVWGYESFSLRSNAYFMVSSVVRSPSINTNFTNNGAKTTYSHNPPITTTITNATLPTLETPFTNSLNFTDLAIAEPDFTNAVDKMPEPKGEKTVVPTIDTNNAHGTSEVTWWNAFWESWGDSEASNRIAGIAQIAGGTAQTIL